MGYAEIMEQGIAKEEDIRRFSGRIHDEAARLLALIKDIIRLSHLDEGIPQSDFETVDLYSLSRQVVADLQKKAADRKVDLRLIGGPVVVEGMSSTLYEMIYNLCDNAIAYNREGGQVDVDVHTAGGRPVVSVRDTGIGIAPEDQARVFERFFRVDKSHSKNTGGTGLGLSIVKHGALLHNAQVTLQSTPGEGSTFKLTF
jgi:two-component system phosphate regulon sensor histidine kinase PhoR